MSQKGFNLLELMIVVAIIGVLAAIAIPSFQAYVAKAQVAAALAEIIGGKTQAETKINEGISEPVTTAIGIGLKASVRCPTLNVTIGTDGTASIICTMAGRSGVDGNTVTLVRGLDGVWICTASVEAPYVPYGCNKA